MLIDADVKGLEVVAAAWLSGDPVLRAEILDGADIHANNQAALGLPDRLTAKVFKFRYIYGGSAYSYANDPDFTGVSRSERFWQTVIDKYTEKYAGIQAWHCQLLDTVARTGRLEMCTGRTYQFTRRPNGALPDTTIKNYPVQGLGADLVAVARVRLRTLLDQLAEKGTFRLVGTVHDSIVIDTDADSCYNICRIVKQAVEEVPQNFSKLFEVDFDLPITCEIKTGPNLLDLKELQIVD